MSRTKKVRDKKNKKYITRRKQIKKKSNKNVNKRRYKGKIHKKTNTKANNANKTFIIGIITVPLTPNKKYFKVCGDSYIASSHIKWMKKHNVETLIIPYNTDNLKYYFDRIHALYLPSGGAFAGTQLEYYRACKKLIQMALKANELGYYFPVWGCCMGFQQMLIIADGKDDLNRLLTKFDSYDNYMTNIELTRDGQHSKIINGLDLNTLKNITKKKSTLNNHMLGITPERFEKKYLLSQFYKIVGTSKDRNGKEFVAIIESHHYPFYGVQWHPERNNEMDAFVKFFVKEVKKNKKVIKRKKKGPMFTKKINCFNYSEGLYKKCNFYWHNKTSEHNRKLCSYAQLKNLDPDTNGV
tara:strand:+ start:2338 stop:3399 length:1062 start_codon:yes stop_codon:yes gene_type:complete